MKSVLKLYARSFETRPNLTLAIVNGSLMAMGDGGAQLLAGALEEGIGYDLLRTARFASYGSVFGLLSGKWNHYLEVTYPLKFAPSTLPISISLSPPSFNEKSSTGQGSKDSKYSSDSKKSSLKESINVPNLAKRVGLDQLVMAPISLLVFLTTMGLLDGKDFDGIIEKIKTHYVPILLTSYQIWPLWQLLVFRYVPLKYRVPIGAVAGIFWSAYLSTKAENKAIALKA